MARIVGIFENGSTIGNVVDQLQFNNITDVHVIEAGQNIEDMVQQMHVLGVPGDQIAEYRRRLEAQRWLVIVQASALELPTVQRAFRSGQALDIDLLPESMA